MTSFRGVAAGAALLAIGLHVYPAHAEIPVKTAYYSASTVAGTSLPDPLTPPDGLRVTQGGEEPMAYSALSYDLRGRQTTAASLVLLLGNGTSGTVELTVCPAKDPAWQPGPNQPIEAGPEPDCEAGKAVEGAVNAGRVEFALGTKQHSGDGYDLVVVPSEGSAPFNAQIAPPDVDSLSLAGTSTSTGSTTTEGTQEQPPIGGGLETGPLGPGSFGPAPDSGFSGVAGGAMTGSTDAPMLADVVVPPPQTAVGGSSTLPSAVLPGSIARAAAPVLDDARDRTVATLLLALVVVALLQAAGRPVPAPRLIGGPLSAGHQAPSALPDDAGASARVRGLGRFRSPRTGPARSLR